MKIKSSDFVISVVDKSKSPKRKLPEIAVSGRSNVGKSSLINSILNRRGLAKTSSTPGKTRLLNYFLINDNFYLVDLPGYGYAKASKAAQETWKNFIEAYLEDNENLKVVLQLIDIRHELKDNDRMMLDYLTSFSIPYVIILTKSDKLNQNELRKQVNYFSTILPGANLITSSSEKGTGKDGILRAIEAYL